VFEVKQSQSKSTSVVHLGAKIVEQDVRVRGAEGHAGGNPENDMEEPADPVPQKLVWLIGVVAPTLNLRLVQASFISIFPRRKKKGASQSSIRTKICFSLSPIYFIVIPFFFRKTCNTH